MSPAFKNILLRIFEHEGGYTNNPNDRGNWTTGVINQGQCKGTKYGISAMSYPNLDIKNLTIDQAAEIYYRDFWKKNKLDLLDLNLAYQIFDAAIQHGSKTAIKILQRAVEVDDDGIIGINTLNAINRVGPVKTMFLFIHKRMDYYTSLSTSNWSRFGLGWMRRMSTNIKYATEDLNK
jgi:lysozyme family protein